VRVKVSEATKPQHVDQLIHMLRKFYTTAIRSTNSTVTTRRFVEQILEGSRWHASGNTDETKRR
jgi:hypothetical protein